MNDLIIKLETYFDTHMKVEKDPVLIKLLNGDSQEFNNIKLIYDAIIWTLENNSSCTALHKEN